MQKIVPNLWFDTQAEEAAKFYVSLFKNSKIIEVSRYGEAGPRPAGMVMVVSFQLDGQDYVALNGGPEFKFTEAISLLVNCKDQAEVDHLWDRLSEGGEKGPCGWLKDRYGLSWQIVPTILNELMADKDPVKVTAGDCSHAADGQTRHPGTAGCLRWEMNRNLPPIPPPGSLPSKLGAPALRALAGSGIHNLEQLCRFSEAEIKTLHGIGPNALEKLRQALKEAGLSFAKGTVHGN